MRGLRREARLHPNYPAHPIEQEFQMMDCRVVLFKTRVALLPGNDIP
jgi:hypothetical protein